MSEKDSLVSMSTNQETPHDAKASDFPKSGGGMQAEGKDSLCSQSEMQCSPRHEQDGGPGSSGAGTPSEWGKGGTGFKVERNKGEGDSAPSSIGATGSIDLETGKMIVDGYKGTKNGEVGAPGHSIPSN